MNKNKVIFILSCAALFTSMMLWKEMFVFTKNGISYPNMAHFLTLISLAPVMLLTPLNDNLIRKILIIALLIPFLVIFLSNLPHGQFIPKTLVELTWAVLLYTVPVSILLGISRYLFFVASQASHNR